MAWNDSIDGQALEIASSDERRIRVVAGPGSGKTFSLMRRIARLLENGVNPHSILLSTFTRTAANDLKKELLKLGVTGADVVKAGTLHSSCYGILLKDSVFEITGRHTRPLFNYEIEFVVFDLMRKTGLGKKMAEKLSDLGKRLGTNPEKMSPYHNIVGKLPPTIIFHGTGDETVPFATVQLFTKKMHEFGNKCILVAYHREPHGFFNYGINSNAVFFDTLRKMDEFLVSLGYLKAPPGSVVSTN